MNLKRKTNRLILRPFQASDYWPWHRTLSSMLPKQNPWDIAADAKDDLSRRKFSQVLKDQSTKQENDSSYRLGLFLKDKQLVGTISIFGINRGPYQSADFGFQIFNQFWGKGYGREAARVGVGVAFKELKLHRLEAKVPLRNQRSLRVIRGLGFRKEGISKRRLSVNGDWIDVYIFALTTEDLLG